MLAKKGTVVSSDLHKNGLATWSPLQPLVRL